MNIVWKPSNVSLLAQDGHFRAVFDTSWKVVAKLWELIKDAIENNIEGMYTLGPDVHETLHLKQWPSI